MKVKSELDAPFLEQLTETFRGVAHPIRMRIIELLFHSGSSTVTKIHTTLNIEQAVASHHLRILKDSTVVTSVREGKNCYYQLKSPVFFEILLMMK
jgi:DNA-binding transcriptional ArsR family regulator